MNKTDKDINHVTLSGANIFADLGFGRQEANKLKIKAQLMSQVSVWIKEKQLTQEEAAKVLNVTRPRVSDVMRGKIGKFTIDALVDMVERTGHQVTLSVA